MTYVFFKDNNLWYPIYITFISWLPYQNSIHSVLYPKVCSPSLLWCKLFIATRLFVKINISYLNAFSLFIFKYRPFYITEATLNANNYIDICSIPSKFHMCMYDRLKNIYAQNQSSKHCSCVKKAVHNRTFWRTLVSFFNLEHKSILLLFCYEGLFRFSDISVILRGDNQSLIS